MKKVVLNFGLVSVVTLAGVMSQTASAQEVVDQKGTSDVTVTIKDDIDPENPDIDPLDPTNPEQNQLLLTDVPTSYDFDSILTLGEYSLTSSLTDQKINVFNTRSIREWSVKAAIVDNKISKEGIDFPVSSFKINDVELVGSGQTGIVSKSNETPTVENNTGNIVTDVTNASINFTDANSELKVGDSLQGTITYQLYNTENAQ